FVGAGYAGVEGLAELQDFAAQAIELYPRCQAHGMRWVLVEARERIMGEVPPTLSTFAEGELRRRGIEVRTSTTLSEVGPPGASVPLQDQRRGRRAGTQPGGRDHARDPLAGPAGVADRPHLPPAADAGGRPAPAPARRLERGAGVRARGLRAGAPGQPDAPR